MIIKFNMMEIKQIQKIYKTPILELIFKAQKVHQKNFKKNEIQTSTLINIKSGGCKEDCSYCSQSVKNNSKLKIYKLMSVEEVAALATEAQKNGASRVCLGAAWREIRNTSDFDTILEMIRVIKAKKMEVCCTLGFVTQEQANKLAKAGLDYYNHNIETSKENYPNIVSTHTFEDRLATLETAKNAGLNLCSGGIIGLGETLDDRISMIHSLANLNPQPNSIPINTLVKIEGTSVSVNQTISTLELIKTIATIRLVCPKSDIRLSAGRESFSIETQILCFLAGANSIFIGDKLLTSPNNKVQEDLEMFELLGLTMSKVNS